MQFHRGITWVRSMVDLTKSSFIVLVLMVGGLLVYHLVPIKDARKIPSTRLVRFKFDQAVTELHRNLNLAHTAEDRGDAVQTRGTGTGFSTVEEYKQAVKYFRRAKVYAGQRRSDAYINDLINRSLTRLHAKIEKHQGQ